MDQPHLSPPPAALPVGEVPPDGQSSHLLGSCSACGAFASASEPGAGGERACASCGLASPFRPPCGVCGCSVEQDTWGERVCFCDPCSAQGCHTFSSYDEYMATVRTWFDLERLRWQRRPHRPKVPAYAPRTWWAQLPIFRGGAPAPLAADAGALAEEQARVVAAACAELERAVELEGAAQTEGGAAPAAVVLGGGGNNGGGSDDIDGGSGNSMALSPRFAALGEEKFAFLLTRLAQNGYGDVALPLASLDRATRGDAELWAALKDLPHVRCAAAPALSSPAALPGRGRTRLMHAALTANAPRLRFLLRLGANPRLTDASGATALHWALHGPLSAATVDVVGLLLKGGADPTLALASGTHDRAATSPAWPFLRNAAGVTALHLAASAPPSAESLAIVEALLCAGADPAARTCRGGHTPLHFACCAGNAAAARALLCAGSELHATTTQTRFSPIECAFWCGHGDLARALFEAGAVPTELCVRGAARAGDAAALAWLLPLLPPLAAWPNPQVTAQAYNGAPLRYLAIMELPPLSLAALWGRAQTVEALLAAGAPVDDVDSLGWTALYACCNHAASGLGPLLRTHGPMRSYYAHEIEDSPELHLLVNFAAPSLLASAGARRTIVAALVKAGAHIKLAYDSRADALDALVDAASAPFDWGGLDWNGRLRLGAPVVARSLLTELPWATPADALLAGCGEAVARLGRAALEAGEAQQHPLPDLVCAAAGTGQCVLLLSLLARPGADVNARCALGCPPLFAAVFFSQWGAAAQLLRAGADPRARKLPRGYMPDIGCHFPWYRLSFTPDPVQLSRPAVAGVCDSGGGPRRPRLSFSVFYAARVSEPTAPRLEVAWRSGLLPGFPPPAAALPLLPTLRGAATPLHALQLLREVLNGHHWPESGGPGVLVVVPDSPSVPLRAPFVERARIFYHLEPRCLTDTGADLACALRWAGYDAAFLSADSPFSLDRMIRITPDTNSYVAPVALVATPRSLALHGDALRARLGAGWAEVVVALPFDCRVGRHLVGVAGTWQCDLLNMLFLPDDYTALTSSVEAALLFERACNELAVPVAVSAAVVAEASACVREPGARIFLPVVI